MNTVITPELKNHLLQIQKTEITEAIVYKKLAKLTKDTTSKKILLQIAEDELRHYQIWKSYTGKDVKASKRKIWFYIRITRLFGITF
jgi:rubrerythrin